MNKKFIKNNLPAICEKTYLVSLCALLLSLILGSLFVNFFLFLISISCLVYVLLNDTLKKKINFKFNYQVILLSFFLIVFISTIPTLNIVSILKSFFVIKFFFLFISFNIFEKVITKNLKYISGIFLSVFLFVLIDTYIQFFFVKDLFGYEIIFPSENNYRLTGPFKDEQIPGAFLSKLAFISLYFLTYLKCEKWKATLIFILVFLCVFFSGERIAFYQLALGIFIFTIINLYHHPKNFKIAFLTILVIVCIIPILINKFPNSIKRHTYFFDQVINFKNLSHWAHFKLGIETFNQNKVIGSGYKQFRIECKKNEHIIKFKVRGNEEICSTHPHNIYIEILSEHGLLGFLIFIMFLYKIFRCSIFKNNNNINKYFLLISVLIIFWPLRSSGSLLTTWNGTLIFFNLGLLNYIIYKSQSS